MSEPSARVETVPRTLLVALVVSLVCSAVVASAAVVLRPLQLENQRQDIRRNILTVAGLLDQGGELDGTFESIEVRVIDFATGQYSDAVDPASFDALAAARDPELSVAVPPEIDQARVGRRSKLGLVYLVRDGDALDRIVLPVSGYGLWSTMYGFIALEADGNTVADVVFYEHGETPGLGDQIANRDWNAAWQDKRIYDPSGNVRFEVIKGQVGADDPQADYRVDGISGATLTGDGVTRLIGYWLGDHGYGPYLKRLHEPQDEEET